MSAAFGSDEFIAMTFKPYSTDVLDAKALGDLKALQMQLNRVSGVAGTFSMLNAPLLNSSNLSLQELQNNLHTLESPGIDRNLARAELTESPIFSNYLIANDASATVIRIGQIRDRELEQMRLIQGGNTTVQKDEIAKRLRVAKKTYAKNRQRLIDEVIDIGKQYKGAEIHVTGVPMIAADMVKYARSDLQNFGGIILMVISGSMWVFFRRLRWIVLPLLSVIVSVYLTVSMLGFLELPVTVVSSNFIALLSIICLSFSIHLIVRYRELLNRHSDQSQRWLVHETMLSKFQPCLYTALTTFIAFGSMTFSGIVPIEDFGWMMCAGVMISFAVTFMLFPSLLLILRKQAPSISSRSKIRVNQLLILLSQKYPVQVLGFSVGLALASAVGFNLYRLKIVSSIISRPILMCRVACYSLIKS